MIREYFGSNEAIDVDYDNSSSGLSAINVQQAIDELTIKSSLIDGEVDTFSELPNLSDHVGEIWAVKTTTGIMGINRKVKGWYISDGIEWSKLNNEYSADKTYFDNSGTELSSNNTQNAIVELENKKANIVDVQSIYESSPDKVLDDVNSLSLSTDIAIEPTVEGQMVWSQDDMTASLKLNDEVILQLGQELLVRSKNTSGSPIPNGTVLMVTGAVGNSGTITIAPHDGTKTNGRKIAGIATQDFAVNEIGFSLLRGKLRGIDCTGALSGEIWNEGDILYVGANGLLTNVKPSAGNLLMLVGVVINNTNHGTLQIRVSGIDEDVSSQDVYYSGLLTSSNVKEALDELEDKKANISEIGTEADFVSALN